MKQYNRIMLGKGGRYAEVCRREGYIGADFSIPQDLTGQFTEKWRDFNKKFIPILMAHEPGRSKTAAGLQCGYLWTICYGLKEGDVVLCPSGQGFYYVGVISGDYYYMPNTELPHRRKVTWQDRVIYRKDMSVNLRNSSGAIGTCCNITKYAEELDVLLYGAPQPQQTEKEEEHQEKNYLERDLHKLFCTWLRNEDIFAKTIFHEKSNRSDSAQKWVHPDIIGVQFEEFDNEVTLSLLKATEPKETVNIYSFEMKRKIENDSQLKEYYFQALSNSSWANYGYLVAFEINEALKEEMSRLNSAFGIGIIQLNTNDYTILFRAKEHPLDYNTIDKLNKNNPNFQEFMKKLSKVLLASKDYTDDARKSLISICDKVFESDDEIESYCKEHNIPF